MPCAFSTNNCKMWIYCRINIGLLKTKSMLLFSFVLFGLVFKRERDIALSFGLGNRNQFENSEVKIGLKACRLTLFPV